MVKPVVEAKLVTFKLVVVERLAKRLVVEPVVVKKEEVVALVAIRVPTAVLPRVVEPVVKMFPAVR